MAYNSLKTLHIIASENTDDSDLTLVSLFSNVFAAENTELVDVKPVVARKVSKNQFYGVQVNNSYAPITSGRLFGSVMRRRLQFLTDFRSFRLLSDYSDGVTYQVANLVTVASYGEHEMIWPKQG